MRRPAVAIILCAALALGTSACGAATERAGEGAPRPVRAADDYIVPASNTISSSDDPAGVARFPNGRDNDETSETGADEPDPCSFVPLAAAKGILGEPVHSSVGDRGPTCIYAPANAANMVTLVVERTSLAALRREASGARAVEVGSRSGWCLRYGSGAVVVPLSDGTVLHVTGPCPLAARFAARALG
jgi:hypothetical protein